MEQAREKYLSKKILKLLIVLFCLFLISFLWLIKEKIGEVWAGEEDKALGWAWSENFGWFSANCTNLAECPVAVPPPFDYGLDIKEDGRLEGYLWAENIGWIQFGNLVGAPAPGQAFYDKTTAKVSGWAKILNLGEDGWLRLRGSTVSVGSGPYRSCADCKDIKDEEGNLIDVQCNICFKSELYGGSGNICNNCLSCTRGADENICDICVECNDYGTAIDRVTGKIVGWAWNGNSNPVVGVGWLNFSPKLGGVVVKAPWLETFFGELYSKSYIGSPSDFVPLMQKYNATYCLMPAGAVTHFTSQTGCNLSPFEEINYPKSVNRYTNVLGKIDIDGILSGRYGTVKTITDSSGIESMLGGKVYYRNGDLTLDAKMFSNGTGGQKGTGLILVKGNLNIIGDITYQSGNVNNLKNLASLGWMILDDGTGTKGNVYISPGVSDLAGNFYAEGTIFTGTTGDPDTDVSLTVKGVMLAKMFKFQRLWASAERGSEQVIYDGRVLANTPPGMEDIVKALPTWRETAP
jgi:hypothetical protein